MARLTITVEVDEAPTLVDPHDIAELVIDSYDETRLASAARPEVKFVDAQWEEP